MDVQSFEMKIKWLPEEVENLIYGEMSYILYKT